MVQSIKQKISNHFFNILERMICFRFITLLILLVFFMDIFLKPLHSSIRILGINANIIILPFLQTCNYFMKIIFLGIIYFYSNVPFMAKEELFYFVKLGKERWGKRNLIYLLISAGIITIFLQVISMLNIITVSDFSNAWGKAVKTLSLTGGTGLYFQIPYPIINHFNPLDLFVIQTSINYLAVLFIGLIMYFISLFGYRKIACIVAIILVFLPSVDAWLGGIILYYSPISWVSCNNWRIGYEYEKPDLQYIFVALLFLNSLFIFLTHKIIRKMEWKSQND